MVVRIVSEKKFIECHHCKTTLEYDTKEDIKILKFRDYLGDGDYLPYVLCPRCKNYALVKT